jgi:hypothetical protein
MKTLICFILNVSLLAATNAHAHGNFSHSIKLACASVWVLQASPHHSSGAPVENMTLKLIDWIDAAESTLRDHSFKDIKVAKNLYEQIYDMKEILQQFLANPSSNVKILIPLINDRTENLQKNLQKLVELDPNRPPDVEVQQRTFADLAPAEVQPNVSYPVTTAEGSNLNIVFTQKIVRHVFQNRDQRYQEISAAIISAIANGFQSQGSNFLVRVGGDTWIIKTHHTGQNGAFRLFGARDGNKIIFAYFIDESDHTWTKHRDNVIAALKRYRKDTTIHPIAEQFAIQ